MEKKEKMKGRGTKKIHLAIIEHDQYSFVLHIQIVILLSRNKWSCLVGDAKLIFKANKDLGQCNCFKI